MAMNNFNDGNYLFGVPARRGVFGSQPNTIEDFATAIGSAIVTAAAGGTTTNARESEFEDAYQLVATNGNDKIYAYKDPVMTIGYNPSVTNLPGVIEFNNNTVVDYSPTTGQTKVGITGSELVLKAGDVELHMPSTHSAIQENKNLQLQYLGAPQSGRNQWQFKYANPPISTPLLQGGNVFYQMPTTTPLVNQILAVQDPGIEVVQLEFINPPTGGSITVDGQTLAISVIEDNPDQFTKIRPANAANMLIVESDNSIIMDTAPGKSIYLQGGTSTIIRSKNTTIDSRSTDGTIELETAAGDIDISTLSGNINIASGTGGDVELDSGRHFGIMASQDITFTAPLLNYVAATSTTTCSGAIAINSQAGVALSGQSDTSVTSVTGALLLSGNSNVSITAPELKTPALYGGGGKAAGGSAYPCIGSGLYYAQAEGLGCTLARIGTMANNFAKRATWVRIGQIVTVSGTLEYMASNATWTILIPLPTDGAFNAPDIIASGILTDQGGNSYPITADVMYSGSNFYADAVRRNSVAAYGYTTLYNGGNDSVKKYATYIFTYEVRDYGQSNYISTTQARRARYPGCKDVSQLTNDSLIAP